MIYLVTVNNKLYSVKFTLRGIHEYIPPTETIVTQLYTEVSKIDTANNLTKTLTLLLKEQLPKQGKLNHLPD